MGLWTFIKRSDLISLSRVTSDLLKSLNAISIFINYIYVQKTLANL